MIGAKVELTKAVNILSALCEKKYFFSACIGIGFCESAFCSQFYTLTYLAIRNQNVCPVGLFGARRGAEGYLW